MSTLEPRLLPMIKWVAQQARCRFASIPTEAIETEMFEMSLQVGVVGRGGSGGSDREW
jgi:hypothetical protein